jgi:hypothetical protein
MESNKKNSYLTFDGTSLRDVIVDRLNKEGIFTDQIYQGSNLSAFIDIISYSFSTLMFYLNKTSSENMFSESQLYENMNRIIKLLNYKPVGKLGQTVPISLNVSNLNAGNYNIPRYSYLQAGGTFFSFPTDLAFTKNINGDEEILNLNNKFILKQGLYAELPVYNAVGFDNETVFINTKNISIDHFSIDVYVKREKSNTWEKWERVDELFTKRSNNNVYEIRYNSNKNYEIRFGDDINGSKLNANDQVSVFYLKINPEASTIGKNALLSSNIILYNSLIYGQILEGSEFKFLTPQEIRNVKLDNEFSSTDYTDEESVDSIRANAPKVFRTQNRLVTTSDFETIIDVFFQNIISDVKVVNNDDYLKNHIKYLFDIGLKNPQFENSVLFNQINFSTSCNFNNIYGYLIPKNEDQIYLNPAQKEQIINFLKDIQILTSNFVPIDPVYIFMDFYINSPDIEKTIDDIGNVKFIIKKSPNTKRTTSAILSDVVNIFRSNFNRQVNKIGQLIDIYQINSSILSIDGIESTQTKRMDTGLAVDGISLLMWNNVYPDLDLKTFNQNILLKNFQYPIFNSIENITNRIEVVEETGVIKSLDL